MCINLAHLWTTISVFFFFFFFSVYQYVGRRNNHHDLLNSIELLFFSLPRLQIGAPENERLLHRQNSIKLNQILLSYDDYSNPHHIPFFVFFNFCVPLAVTNGGLHFSFHICRETASIYTHLFKIVIFQWPRLLFSSAVFGRLFPGHIYALVDCIQVLYT